jgi:hypothetical protein
MPPRPTRLATAFASRGQASVPARRELATQTTRKAEAPSTTASDAARTLPQEPRQEEYPVSASLLGLLGWMPPHPRARLCPWVSSHASALTARSRREEAAGSEACTSSLECVSSRAADVPAYGDEQVRRDAQVAELHSRLRGRGMRAQLRGRVCPRGVTSSCRSTGRARPDGRKGDPRARPASRSTSATVRAPARSVTRRLWPVRCAAESRTRAPRPAPPATSRSKCCAARTM